MSGSRAHYSGQGGDALMKPVEEESREQTHDHGGHSPNQIGNEDSADFNQISGQFMRNITQIDTYLNNNASHGQQLKFRTEPSKKHGNVQRSGGGVSSFNPHNEFQSDIDEEVKEGHRPTRMSIINTETINNQVVHSVPSNELARLGKSKQDIYSILLTQGMKFISHLYMQVLRNHEVRIISVPKLNELSVINLISDIKNEPDICKYLPDIKDGKLISRQFLYNIINTVKPEFFPSNIKASLEFRQKQKTLDKNKFIKLTAEMFGVLENAVITSVSNRGRAVNLLNQGTKKRKRPSKQTQQINAPRVPLSQFESHADALSPRQYVKAKRMNHNPSFNQPSSNHMIELNQSLITQNSSMIQINQKPGRTHGTAKLQRQAERTTQAAIRLPAQHAQAYQVQVYRKRKYLQQDDAFEVENHKGDLFCKCEEFNISVKAGAEFKLTVASSNNDPVRVLITPADGESYMLSSCA
eukprot:403362955